MRKLIIMFCLLFLFIGCQTKPSNLNDYSNNETSNNVDETKEDKQEESENRTTLNSFEKVEIDPNEYKHIHTYPTSFSGNYLSKWKAVGIGEQVSTIIEYDDSKWVVQDYSNNMVYSYTAENDDFKSILDSEYFSVLAAYQNVAVVTGGNWEGQSNFKVEELNGDKFVVLGGWFQSHNKIIDNMFYYVMRNQDQERGIYAIYQIDLETFEIKEIGVVNHPQPLTSDYGEFNVISINDKVYFKFEKDIYLFENNNFSKLDFGFSNAGRVMGDFVSNDDRIYAIRLTKEDELTLFIWDENWNVKQRIVLPKIEQYHYFTAKNTKVIHKKNDLNLIGDNLYIKAVAYKENGQQNYTGQTEGIITYEYNLTSNQVKVVLPLIWLEDSVVRGY